MTNRTDAGRPTWVIPRLIDAQPVGKARSMTHLNFGDRPHEFRMVEHPIYPQYPDGDRLREARQALDLSQREAAGRLGLSVADYSALEHGKKVLAEGDRMDGVIEALRGKSAAVAPARSALPSAEKIAEMLDDCAGARDVLACNGGPGFNDWEREFIDSAADQFSERGRLSDKQTTVLERLWAKI